MKPTAQSSSRRCASYSFHLGNRRSVLVALLSIDQGLSGPTHSHPIATGFRTSEPPRSRLPRQRSSAQTTGRSEDQGKNEEDSSDRNEDFQNEGEVGWAGTVRGGTTPSTLFAEVGSDRARETEPNLTGTGDAEHSDWADV